MDQNGLLQFYSMKVDMDNLPQNDRFKFLFEHTIKENGITYGYGNVFVEVSPEETDLLRLWYLYNSVFFLSVHYKDSDYVAKFDFILDYLSSVILYRTPAEACKEIDQYTLWPFDKLEEESTQKLHLLTALGEVDSARTIKEEKKIRQETSQKLEALFSVLEAEHFFAQNS